MLWKRGHKINVLSCKRGSEKNKPRNEKEKKLRRKVWIFEIESRQKERFLGSRLLRKDNMGRGFVTGKKILGIKNLRVGGGLKVE